MEHYRDLFQSAPSHAAGRNATIKAGSTGGIGFNPLPATRPGETSGLVLDRQRLPVSIRSQPRGREKHVRDPARHRRTNVSIRSQPRGREKPPMGDCQPGHHVSIRSQPRGREKRLAAGCLSLAIEFQSAPSHAAGRNMCPGAIGRGGSVSIRSQPRGREKPQREASHQTANPVSIRSQPRGREKPLRQAVQGSIQVSIRSQPRGREKLGDGRDQPVGGMFQSAPSHAAGRNWLAVTSCCKPSRGADFAYPPPRDD